MSERKRVRPGEVKTTRAGKTARGGKFDDESERPGDGADDLGGLFHTPGELRQGRQLEDDGSKPVSLSHEQVREQRSALRSQAVASGVSEAARRDARQMASCLEDMDAGCLDASSAARLGVLIGYKVGYRDMVLLHAMSPGTSLDQLAEATAKPFDQESEKLVAHVLGQAIHSDDRPDLVRFEAYDRQLAHVEGSMADPVDKAPILGARAYLAWYRGSREQAGDLAVATQAAAPHEANVLSRIVESMLDRDISPGWLGEWSGV